MLEPLTAEKVQLINDLTNNDCDVTLINTIIQYASSQGDLPPNVVDIVGYLEAVISTKSDSLAIEFGSLFEHDLAEYCSF